MSEFMWVALKSVYWEYNGDGTTVTLERETLHVMDDQQRIAQVDTRTQGNDGTLAQRKSPPSTG